MTDKEILGGIKMEYTKENLENIDPYENLANVIVLQAVKDYRDALKRLKTAMADATECERFFRSGWYKTLTSVDGEYLITKLREEALEE